MDTTLRDETAYLEMVQDRKSKIQQLQKDIEDQGVKLERVKKQVCRYHFPNMKTFNSFLVLLCPFLQRMIVLTYLFFHSTDFKSDS